MFFYILIILLAITAYYLFTKYNRTPIQISQMYFYPIKSCGRIALTQATVQLGIAYDRQWQIINSKHEKVSLKDIGTLLLLQPIPQYQGNQLTILTLTYPGHQNFDLKVKKDYQNFFKLQQDNNRTVSDQGDQVAQWLRSIFKQDYRLVRNSVPHQINQLEIYTDLSECSDDKKVGFCNAGQFHILSEQSYKAMYNFLPEYKQKDIDIYSFRPSIILKNCRPFEEDRFRLFKIGEITFENLCKTYRCREVIVSPNTYEHDKHFEPVTTLRRINGNKARGYLGLWCIKHNEGVLRVGDKLTVLSRNPKWLEGLVKDIL